MPAEQGSRSPMAIAVVPHAEVRVQSDSIQEMVSRSAYLCIRALILRGCMEGTRNRSQTSDNKTVHLCGVHSTVQPSISYGGGYTIPRTVSRSFESPNFPIVSIVYSLVRDSLTKIYGSCARGMDDEGMCSLL